MSHSWINDLCAVVADKVQNISSIWDAIGIDGNRLQKRKETLHEHVCSMLDDMYDEESTAQKTIEASIDNLLVQINELEVELGLPHIQMSSLHSLPLTEKALFDRFESLQERAVAIKLTHDSLRQEEELLAERLSESPCVICFRHAPNQDQMHTLKASIDKLTLMKRSRLLQLTESRQYILHVSSTVDMPANLSGSDLLQQLRIENALETLPLSETFLNDVANLKSQCEDIFAAVYEDCNALVGQITCLAGRLNLEHDQFIDVDRQISSQFLYELREESHRLIELRRSNLSVLIHNCRTELQDTWDFCRLAGNDRKTHLLTGDVYTEDILEVLESEITHWKRFYTTYQEVFEALESWEVTFFKYREIEIKKKDPAILKNRGGILLKVEKEYKQAQRDLKRLSSQIQELMDQPTFYSLTVHGLSVMQFLEASQRRFAEDKENDGKQRQLKRKLDGPTPKHAAMTQRAGTNKTAILNESSFCSSISGRSKKPRVDMTRTPISRAPATSKYPRSAASARTATWQTPISSTPVRKLPAPTTCPPKSVKGIGAMTSTPRHSREFVR